MTPICAWQQWTASTSRHPTKHQWSRYRELEAESEASSSTAATADHNLPTSERFQLPHGESRYVFLCWVGRYHSVPFLCAAWSLATLLAIRRSALQRVLLCGSIACKHPWEGCPFCEPFLLWLVPRVRGAGLAPRLAYTCTARRVRSRRTSGTYTVSSLVRLLRHTLQYSPC